ncbi:unnamed protein product [Eruca vesicaria subsp. sativa]|uniref:Uncharacterized protein n=1 Tax=Eruca vesicaria subsp. sativa TaxID=29727 RepID=A0ABC8M4Z6_ERUVS|nr:unnamed protein product [Eruca vesicaria subsp. sativa]
MTVMKRCLLERTVDTLEGRFLKTRMMVLSALTRRNLVCLADLEFDYINPYDSASRINSVLLEATTLGRCNRDIQSA